MNDKRKMAKMGGARDQEEKKRCSCDRRRCARAEDSKVERENNEAKDKGNQCVEYSWSNPIDENVMAVMIADA